MRTSIFSLKNLLLLIGLLLILIPSVNAQGFRDRLEGLVYEVEEWSEPKAWLKDQSASDKWTLWTKEEDVINKRSKGAALHTPSLPKKDRISPEEGAPVLRTKITGIPNGRYNVWSNPTNRPLAFSFDKGKTWVPAERTGEEFFGTYEIKDGSFEVWADDRYAGEPNSPGWSYYDYIRFVKIDDNTKETSISDLKAFTLPDGSTQLSWKTTIPTTAAIIKYGPGNNRSSVIYEKEKGQRNHQVILSDLQNGQTCSAEVTVPINRAGAGKSQKIVFRSGKKPVPGPTQSAKIRLTVSEPTQKGRQNWPLTSGVPFARGVLASANDIQLTDEKGTVLPAQFDTFCTWPDGSVKWLICNFRTDTQPGKPTVYYLKTGSDFPKDQAETKNAKSENSISGSVLIDAAGLKLSEHQKQRINDLVKKISSKVVLTDGSVYQCRPDQFKAESAGPFCVTVRGFGKYLKEGGSDESDKKTANAPVKETAEKTDPKTEQIVSDENEEGFRWRCDLTLFGDDFARIRWSVGNHILKKIMTSVKSADLAFETATGDQFTFSDGKNAKTKASFLQETEKTASADLDGQQSKQEHFDGFVQTGGKSWFFRDFWQTWPKGLECEKNKIVFNILPALPDGYKPEKSDTVNEILTHYYWLKDNAYQFKRGMEIRHDLWIAENKTQKDPAALAQHFEIPVFAVCDSEYYCSTGTFPPCNPAKAGEFDVYEKAFQTSFDNFEKGRQKRGEYGWMNFGDWFGERTWNWGNNEYDGTYVCLLHFIRSGKTEYLRRGIEFARHYSTVDFKAYPWDPKMRELMYIHCYGHVNYFFTEDDPRIQKIKNATEYGMFRWESDGSGGHAFQPGNFFAACMTGDRRIFEVAETACTNQAQRYTPNFNFSIERAAGWALTNAVNAYLFTGNPFYLNAADLYFEVIASKQDKETGCFNLPQDQSECNCPDKKEHRGGKAFAVGILMHGLIRYYEVTKNPEVRNVVVRCCDWLLDYSWNEEKHGFRYKTGCPKYANSGWYSILVTEGIGFSGDVTGDKRYLDFLVRTIGPELTNTSGTGLACGKEFDQRFRQIPHTLYYLQKHGYKNVDTVRVPIQ